MTSSVDRRPAGSAEWNDAVYFVGIVTFGSTEHGGKSDSNCKGYNPSMCGAPQLLGHTQSAQSTQVSQSQPRTQSRGGRGFGNY